MSEETPADRLRAARKKAGFKTATAAAQAIGSHPATYSAHENGNREFNRQDAVHYGNKFRVQPAWLMFGTASTFEATVVLELDLRETEAEVAGGKSAVDSSGTISPKAASATWQIPADFMTGRLRIKPKDAWVIPYEGDSMYNPSEPGAPGSIMPGDRVIIDTADKRPSPPGAFAIHDGSGIQIKMLEILPMTNPVMVRISCRNPLYSVYERELRGTTILGRVRAKIGAL